MKLNGAKPGEGRGARPTKTRMLWVVYVPYREAIERDQRLAKVVVLADEVESTGFSHATKKLNLGHKKRCQAVRLKS